MTRLWIVWGWMVLCWTWTLRVDAAGLSFTMHGDEDRRQVTDDDASSSTVPLLRSRVTRPFFSSRWSWISTGDRGEQNSQQRIRVPEDQSRPDWIVDVEEDIDVEPPPTVDSVDHERELALTLLSSVDGRTGVALEQAWRGFRQLSIPDAANSTMTPSNDHLEAYLRQIDELRTHPLVQRELRAALRMIERQTGCRAVHDLQSIFDHSLRIVHSVAAMERTLFTDFQPVLRYMAESSPSAMHDRPPVGDELIMLAVITLQQVRSHLRNVPFLTLMKMRCDPEARTALARHITHAIFGSLPLDVRLKRLSMLCRGVSRIMLGQPTVSRHLCGSYVQWRQSSSNGAADTHGGSEMARFIANTFSRPRRTNSQRQQRLPRLFRSTDACIEQLRTIPSIQQLFFDDISTTQLAYTILKSVLSGYVLSCHLWFALIVVYAMTGYSPAPFFSSYIPMLSTFVALYWSRYGQCVDVQNEWLRQQFPWPPEVPLENGDDGEDGEEH